MIFVRHGDDIQGLAAVGVNDAGLADSPVGRQVLTHVAAVAPTVSKAWVDGGYNDKVVEHGADPGIDVEVVRRGPHVPGFRVLSRRWVVESAFGWFMLHRRLVHGYETC